MKLQVALVDELRPAVAEWLASMTPAGMAALRRASKIVVGRTVDHMRAQLHVRTGRRAPLVARSLGVKIDRRTGGHPYATIWFRRGILAAHELGSTIPGGLVRPRRAKVLAWGGAPGAREHFARSVMRPTRTLRRRPMLEPALRQSEAEILQEITSAYDEVFAKGGTAASIRERIG